MQRWVPPSEMCTYLDNLGTEAARSDAGSTCLRSRHKIHVPLQIKVQELEDKEQLVIGVDNVKKPRNVEPPARTVMQALVVMPS